MEAPRSEETQPVGRLHLFSSDQGPEKDFLLYPGQNTIGRRPDCTVILPFPSISEVHAVIEIPAEGRAPFLQDYHSLNGTYIEVPRRRLSPGMNHQLSDKDLIHFADLQFQFHSLGAPPLPDPDGAMEVEEIPRAPVIGEPQLQGTSLDKDSQKEGGHLEKDQHLTGGDGDKKTDVHDKGSPKGRRPFADGSGRVQMKGTIKKVKNQDHGVRAFLPGTASDLQPGSPEKATSSRSQATDNPKTEIKGQCVQSDMDNQDKQDSPDVRLVSHKAPGSEAPAPAWSTRRTRSQRKGTSKRVHSSPSPAEKTAPETTGSQNKRAGGVASSTWKFQPRIKIQHLTAVTKEPSSCPKEEGREHPQKHAASEKEDDELVEIETAGSSSQRETQEPVTSSSAPTTSLAAELHPAIPKELSMRTESHQQTPKIQKQGAPSKHVSSPAEKPAPQTTGIQSKREGDIASSTWKFQPRDKIQHLPTVTKEPSPCTKEEGREQPQKRAVSEKEDEEPVEVETAGSSFQRETQEPVTSSSAPTTALAAELHPAIPKELSIRTESHQQTPKRQKQGAPTKHVSTPAEKPATGTTGSQSESVGGAPSSTWKFQPRVKIEHLTAVAKEPSPCPKEEVRGQPQKRAASEKVNDEPLEVETAGSSSQRETQEPVISSSVPSTSLAAELHPVIPKELPIRTESHQQTPKRQKQGAPTKHVSTTGAPSSTWKFQPRVKIEHLTAVTKEPSPFPKEEGRGQPQKRAASEKVDDEPVEVETAGSSSQRETQEPVTSSSAPTTSLAAELHPAIPKELSIKTESHQQTPKRQKHGAPTMHVSTPAVKPAPQTTGSQSEGSGGVASSTWKVQPRVKIQHLTAVTKEPSPCPKEEGREQPQKRAASEKEDDKPVEVETAGSSSQKETQEPVTSSSAPPTSLAAELHPAIPKELSIRTESHQETPKKQKQGAPTKHVSIPAETPAPETTGSQSERSGGVASSTWKVQPTVKIQHLTAVTKEPSLCPKEEGRGQPQKRAASEKEDDKPVEVETAGSSSQRETQEPVTSSSAPPTSLAAELHPAIPKELSIRTESHQQTPKRQKQGTPTKHVSTSAEKPAPQTTGSQNKRSGDVASSTWKFQPRVKIEHLTAVTKEPSPCPKEEGREQSQKHAASEKEYDEPVEVETAGSSSQRETQEPVTSSSAPTTSLVAELHTPVPTELSIRTESHQQTPKRQKQGAPTKHVSTPAEKPAPETTGSQSESAGGVASSTWKFQPRVNIEHLTAVTKEPSPCPKEEGREQPQKRASSEKEDDDPVEVETAGSSSQRETPEPVTSSSAPTTSLAAEHHPAIPKELSIRTESHQPTPKRQKQGAPTKHVSIPVVPVFPQHPKERSETLKEPLKTIQSQRVVVEKTCESITVIPKPSSSVTAEKPDPQATGSQSNRAGVVPSSTWKCQSRVKIQHLTEVTKEPSLCPKEQSRWPPQKHSARDKENKPMEVETAVKTPKGATELTIQPQEAVKGMPHQIIGQPSLDEEARALGSGREIRMKSRTFQPTAQEEAQKEQAGKAQDDKKAKSVPESSD